MNSAEFEPFRMDARPQRQHPAIGVPEVCSDVRSGVALPRHQGRHAMPELVRGRPRDASGPSGWIEHAPKPVPRVLQRSGRRGEHGVTVGPPTRLGAPQRQTRAMSGESGTLRRPASVLDTAIRAEARPSASGPTSHHRTFSASEMRHPVEGGSPPVVQGRAAPARMYRPSPPEGHQRWTARSTSDGRRGPQRCTGALRIGNLAARPRSLPHARAHARSARARRGRGPAAIVVHPTRARCEAQ